MDGSTRQTPDVLVMFITICVGENLQSPAQLHGVSIVLIVHMVIYALFCILISGHLRLGIGLDLIAAIIQVTLCFRAAEAVYNGCTEMFMELQTAVRVIVTLMYMDVYKSAVWNCLYMATSCVAISTRPSGHLMSRSLAMQLCVCELASCLIIVAFSFVLESYFVTLVRTRIQAEDNGNAVDKLVLGFCDAMVSLDQQALSSLRIQNYSTCSALDAPIVSTLWRVQSLLSTWRPRWIASAFAS